VVKKLGAKEIKKAKDQHGKLYLALGKKDKTLGMYRPFLDIGIITEHQLSESKRQPTEESTLAYYHKHLKEDNWDYKILAWDKTMLHLVYECNMDWLNAKHFLMDTLRAANKLNNMMQC
jgi:hypothetical protein